MHWCIEGKPVFWEFILVFNALAQSVRKAFVTHVLLLATHFVDNFDILRAREVFHSSK